MNDKTTRLGKILRPPPPGLFRTTGGIIVDWGWPRLVIGRRAWLPLSHPSPSWRVGPVAYYGKEKWT